jgi:hypothetical protein
MLALILSMLLLAPTIHPYGEGPQARPLVAIDAAPGAPFVIESDPAPILVEPLPGASCTGLVCEGGPVILHYAEPPRRIVVQQGGETAVYERGAQPVRYEVWLSLVGA